MSSYGSHRESGSKNRADGGTNVVNSMGYLIEMCVPNVCAHGCKEHGGVRNVPLCPKMPS